MATPCGEKSDFSAGKCASIPPWNNRNISPSPTVTFSYNVGETKGVKPEQYLEMFKEVAQTTVQLQEHLRLEQYTLARLLYKLHNQLKRWRWYQLLAKVEKTVQRIQNVNLLKCVNNIKECCYKEGKTWYLPSRQMIEYMLVKLMSISKLCDYSISLCEQTTVFLVQFLGIGHMINNNIVFCAITSRIWVLLHALQTNAIKWYDKLHSWSAKLKATPTQWLPSDECLPDSLTVWLGSENTSRNLSKKSKTQKLLSKWFSEQDQHHPGLTDDDNASSEDDDVDVSTSLDDIGEPVLDKEKLSAEVTHKPNHVTSPKKRKRRCSKSEEDHLKLDGENVLSTASPIDTKQSPLQGTRMKRKMKCVKADNIETVDENANGKLLSYNSGEYTCNDGESVESQQREVELNAIGVKKKKKKKKKKNETKVAISNHQVISTTVSSADEDKNIPDAHISREPELVDIEQHLESTQKDVVDMEGTVTKMKKKKKKESQELDANVSMENDACTNDIIESTDAIPTLERLVVSGEIARAVESCYAHVDDPVTEQTNTMGSLKKSKKKKKKHKDTRILSSNEPDVSESEVSGEIAAAVESCYAVDDTVTEQNNSTGSMKKSKMKMKKHKDTGHLSSNETNVPEGKDSFVTSSVSVNQLPLEPKKKKKKHKDTGLLLSSEADVSEGEVSGDIATAVESWYAQVPKNTMGSLKKSKKKKKKHKDTELLSSNEPDVPEGKDSFVTSSVSVNQLPLEPKKKKKKHKDTGLLLSSEADVSEGEVSGEIATAVESWYAHVPKNTMGSLKKSLKKNKHKDTGLISSNVPDVSERKDSFDKHSDDVYQSTLVCELGQIKHKSKKKKVSKYDTVIDDIFGTLE